MKNEQFTSLRKIGAEGWNIFDDPQDIKDTQVVDALNVVFDKGYPKPRGGSRRAWDKPEIITYTTVTTPTVQNVVTDSYSETYQDASITVGNDADLEFMGQSFNASSGGDLTNIKLYLSKTGTLDGTIYVKVYAHTGTYGVDGIPTGSPLVTSDGVSANSISLSPALVNFNFSTVYSLVENTKYFLVISYENNTTSKYLNVHYDSTDGDASVHEGNSCYFSDPSWEADATIDVVFYVYVNETVSVETQVPTSTPETQDSLCSFAARASDGTNYAIAVYGTSFYLRDEENDQWVKINNSYTPASDDLMYGYANWNAGIGSDYLYACNGKDSFIKWPIAIGYVATTLASGFSALELSDATKFPASGGNIVIKESNQSEVYLTYLSKSGNTLNLSVPTTVALNAGSCVACQIAENTSIAKGKIVKKFKGRLITANQSGGESTLNGSEVGNPENFVIDTDAGDPFQQVITDGNGGITGVDNFGEYLLVEKEDSLHKIDITTTLDSSGDSYQTLAVVPVAEDLSLGPVQPWARIKKNNRLIFASSKEGIFSINPDITGQQTSIETDVISLPIKPFVANLDFTNSRTTTWDQKILMSTTSSTTSDTILVHDITRGNWSRFNNWPVRDWLIHNKKLYFLSRIDGRFYECFTSDNVDGTSSYESYIVTKAFDFGQGALPKTTNKVFISGYIKPNETLFFDVILTTGDKVITTTYSLAGDGKLVASKIPLALAMQMLGISIMGSVTVNEVNGIFRGYLKIPSRYGFYTLQIKVYSRVDGTDWGLTGIGFSPWLESKAPAQLDIGAVGDPSNDDLV